VERPIKILPTIPEQELLICRRLRRYRLAGRWTQRDFADKLGISKAALASHEYGRAPLRFGPIRQLLESYTINVQWLAEGMGTMKSADVVPPLAIVRSIPPRLLFSDAYKNHIAPAMPRNEQGYLSSPRGGETDSRALALQTAYTIQSKLATLQGSLLEKYLGGLMRLDSGFCEEHAKELKRLRMNEAEEKDLIETFELGIIDGEMKPLLPQLLDRLRKATNARGAKSKLAAELNIPLTSISQWLNQSQDREPGGEQTLKLLAWVQQYEKSRARAATRVRP
jgi:transcriptional regulator with XRE-family HTH domain